MVVLIWRQVFHESAGRQVFSSFFWCVMDRILYGRKHHRTQPAACLYDSSHSLFLTQQPLKSNPTVTSGLPNIIQWSAWCDENNISCSCSLSADLIREGPPISVHSVCLASGSSLSTWHYLNLAVSSPCLHPSVPQTHRLGSDFQITLGENSGCRAEGTKRRFYSKTQWYQI